MARAPQGHMENRLIWAFRTAKIEEKNAFLSGLPGSVGRQTTLEKAWHEATPKERRLLADAFIEVSSLLGTYRRKPRVGRFIRGLVANVVAIAVLLALVGVVVGIVGAVAGWTRDLLSFGEPESGETEVSSTDLFGEW